IPTLQHVDRRKGGDDADSISSGSPAASSVRPWGRRVGCALVVNLPGLLSRRRETTRTSVAVCSIFGRGTDGGPVRAHSGRSAEAALDFAKTVAFSCSSALGDTLVGVILHGSLATAGYLNGKSDIDLLAIVEGPLSD